MIVYLVRHGEAVAEEIDPARPLTEKGREEVEATARELRDEGARVEEIWHSGKLRAKQTAEIIAQVLNVSKVIEKAGLNPNDNVTPIASLIRHSNKSILIAGHLPFIPKLASLLRPELQGKQVIELKLGGVVRIIF